MSVNSPDNINLLMQIFSDNPLNKIDSSEFQKFIFIQTNNVNRNRLNFNNDLTKMNKHIIKLVEQFTNEQLKNTINPNINNHTNKMEKYDSGNNIIQVNNISPSTNDKIKLQPRPDSTSYISKNNKISELKTFEKRLKSQQENFNTFNNIKKPKEIDFSDKPDNNTFNNLSYDSTLAQRENDLNSIIEKYNTKTSKQWLQSENTMTDAKKNEASTKKVSFQLDNNPPSSNVNNDDFFKKLKIIEPTATNSDSNDVTLTNTNEFTLPDILNKQQLEIKRQSSVLDSIIKKQTDILNTVNNIFELIKNK